MQENRARNTKRNMTTTLLAQIVGILCGVVIPSVMLRAYGSESYGTVTSIAQFLSYISLLDGGVGGVARAALYHPLAQNDHEGISRVYYAVRRFFVVVAVVFLGYALALSLGYHDLARVTVFERRVTFWLVAAIGLSTFAQYFWGIAGLTLLNAAQKRYVSDLIVIATTLLNTAVTVLLVRLGCSILQVKLASSLVFLLRPACVSFYVKRRYSLKRPPRQKEAVLAQKWAGLGQHLAYFLHSNTDIAVLTLFADLRLVAVYSIYHLITANMRNLVAAFSGGMEALFGDMLARGQLSQLRKAVRRYQVLLSAAAMLLLGTTAVMILPFVRLYTAGVTDAEYAHPLFAYLLVLAEAVDCMGLPGSSLPVAAGHFKQTRAGAYGQAVLNVALSCLLLQWDPLAGVALGTLISVTYKQLYYNVYASRRLLGQSGSVLVRGFVPPALLFAGVTAAGAALVGRICIESFCAWMLCAALVFAVMAVVTAAFFRAAEQELFDELISQLKKKLSLERRPGC